MDTEGSLGDEAITAKAALDSHYRRYQLPADGGHHQPVWNLSLGGLAIRLPNWSWRKAAIKHHDVHHLLTGYPCTAVGEFQMAAWEFAAGRFPDFRATLFCLPLIGLGSILAPRRTFSAFVRGMRSQTTYSCTTLDDVLNLSVEDAQRAFVECRPVPNRGMVTVRFLMVSTLSLLTMLAPLLLGALVIFRP